MSACRALTLVGALVGATLLTACESDGASAPPTSGSDATPTTVSAEAETDDRYPDIVDVAAEREDESGAWAFRVTVASPYDTPERYADGWRIVGPDGTVYGVHTLLHDHAAEQPFTRTQTGVVIPDDVGEVIVEGRDLANGFGGATVTVTLDRD